jgi:hypothetical protein
VYRVPVKVNQGQSRFRPVFPPGFQWILTSGFSQLSGQTCSQASPTQSKLVKPFWNILTAVFPCIGFPLSVFSFQLFVLGFPVSEFRPLNPARSRSIKPDKGSLVSD